MFPEKAISVHQCRRQSVSSRLLNREVLSKEVARWEVPETQLRSQRVFLN